MKIESTKIFSWLLFFFVLFLFGIVYFLATFFLFEEPQKVKLLDISYKNQNYSITSVFGNAATSGSIQLIEIDNNGNEKQKHFLTTRPYFKKGYQTQINDSLFKCVLIDGSITDTVLLNMETKKMDYYSDSLFNSLFLPQNSNQ